MRGLRLRDVEPDLVGRGRIGATAAVTAILRRATN
jgi:hypothetical protein